MVNMHVCFDVRLPQDDQTFSQALRRARAEFMEMPGLKLTLCQAARLWSMDAATCAAVLARLVDARFLVQTRNASFTRL
jgi:hypothetical protein